MMPILSPWCHRCALSPQGRFRRPSTPQSEPQGAFGEQTKSSVFRVGTGKSQLSLELRFCPRAPKVLLK